MQQLGLSDSAPARTENRFKTLFWPTIRTDGDVEYLAEQGFWICFVIAVFTIIITALAGLRLLGVFESLFYFLAAVGVRQRSRVAAVATFTAYLLGALVIQRFTGQGFGIVRIIFMALLLANVRGTWLAAQWRATDTLPPPVRLTQTFGDRLSDQMPAWLWPKVQILFYAAAAAEIGVLLYELVVPRPT